MPIDPQSTRLLMSEIASGISTLELFSATQLADSCGRTASLSFNALRDRAVELCGAEVDPGQTMAASSRSDLLTAQKRLLIRLQDKTGLVYEEPVQVQEMDSGAVAGQILDSIKSEYFLMKRSSFLGSAVITVLFLMGVFGFGLWGIYQPIETEKISQAESQSEEILLNMESIEASALITANNIKLLATETEAVATDGDKNNASETP